MADADLAFCREHLRDHDRDAYLASLLYPSAHAEALTAIDAFNAEVHRIRDLVSEPMPGEIRLQWWRDAIAGAENGAKANPIASALLSAIEAHGLDRAFFDKLLLARAFDLYEDPMPDLNTLEGYAGETSSALLLLKAQIIGVEHTSVLADATGHAGVALTMIKRLQSFAKDRARGQLFIPLNLLAKHGLDRTAVMSEPDPTSMREVLGDFGEMAVVHQKKALTALEKLPKEARPVFKPLALIPLYKKNIDAPACDPLREVITLLPLRVQWALWRF